jgi:DNA-binding beta-propeller fold protein YncE
MICGEGKFKYELIDGWAKLPEGDSFMDVGGVSVDRQGRVYVLSRSAYPISVFDRDGSILSRWGKGHFQRAHGSCIGPDGSLYCTDDRNHTVSKFTPEGTLLMQFGPKDRPADTGYREGQDLFERIASIKRGGPPFNRPTGIAVTRAGEMYVVDGYGNARVHRFTGGGELVSSWGEPGPGPSQFRLPHNVAVDVQDRVWVVDRENHRIQIFGADGTFLRQWTDLFRPTDLCIDEDGIVYVSELCRRISVFNLEGQLLARFGNESRPPDDPLFIAPHAIAVDSHGDLYVGEVSMTHAKVNKGRNTVQKFVRV